MKKYVMISCAVAVLLFLAVSVYLAVVGLSGGQPGQPPARTPRIAEARAREIAREDAEKAYQDLSAYKVTAALREDGWHVDYELIDKSSQGGGPHYRIDPNDGTILEKEYEQ
jgi:hypothetical protein